LIIRYNKKRGGKVSQKVRLYSDDPDTPVATVLLKGTVKDVVTMSRPAGINFGILGPEQITTQIVEITCAYEQPLALGLQAATAEGFAARLETVESGKRYRLVAETTPPLKVGKINGRVVLLTGLESIPKVIVPIRGKVESAASVVRSGALDEARKNTACQVNADRRRSRQGKREEGRDNTKARP
jgi:hypothetical protein